jgi:hypothetical protein
MEGNEEADPQGKGTEESKKYRRGMGRYAAA